MMGPFIESGMTFGPFPDGHCFRLEQSTAYVRIQQGVKIAEFVHLGDGPRTGTVYIVETKSNSPHTTPESRDGANRLEGFADEVTEKFENSLAFAVACILKRHEAEPELPAAFRKLNLGTTRFTFVLVVRKVPKEALPILSDVLSKKLRRTANAWGLGSSFVVVVNEDGARRRGLTTVPSAAPSE